MNTKDKIAAGLALMACLVIGDKPVSIVLAFGMIAVALVIQLRPRKVRR